MVRWGTPLAFAAAVVFSAGSVLAWSGPTAAPPGSNVPAPVNVSSTFQDKPGAVWFDGGIGIGVDNANSTGAKFCIGTSCITSWSQAGAGGSIAGSGTAGYVPRFSTNGTTLGNASITSDGTNATSTGNFSVANTLKVTGATTASQFCIGTSCVSSWPSGGVTLTGSANYLPKITGSGALGQSLVYDSGSGVGIGTANPGNLLDLKGSAGIIGAGGQAGSIGIVTLETSPASNKLFLGFDKNSPYGGYVQVSNTSLSANAPLLLNPLGGNVGVGATNPRFALEVNGQIINTNAYNANNGLYQYDLGVGSIGAGSSIYSYGPICSGNSWSNCSGTGGSILYPNGSAYFAGNVGINAGVPAARLEVNGSMQLDDRGDGCCSQFRQKSGNTTWDTYTYASGGYGVYQVANTSGAAGAGLVFSLSNTGAAAFSGTVTASAFLYSSDQRLKTDIAPLTGNLSKILQIQPVSYWWKDVSRGTGEQIGFIAQQVQSIVPQLVHTDASTTLESVDYARLTPLLVGSVQELDQKITDQQKQIDAQRQEIDSLKAEVEAMKNK